MILKGLKSKYDIKTAISPDGLKWKKTARTAISLAQKIQILQACVLKKKINLLLGILIVKNSKNTP